jgi:hypothetical protein
MGIIISGFKGCGRTFFTNLNKDKVRIFEKRGELTNDTIEEINNTINDYDVVFVDSDAKSRELLEEHNLDYDIFYPSKERRLEFLENEVKKRTNSKDIQELDRFFNKWIDEIDGDDSENCHKHKLVENGHFIGNDEMIIRYLDAIAKN